jgi:predicted permease
LDALRQDLVLTYRTLARAPGTTAILILTLALGIGATTTIFSVLHAVVIEPLPYAEPDRLYRLIEVTPEGIDYATSEPTFIDYRSQTSSFTDTAAFLWHDFVLRGEEGPEEIKGAVVTPAVFDLLGAAPLFGRTFTEEEGTPAGYTAVLLLSEGVWRDRYAADPEILGRTLVLDAWPHMVVGVMPAEFEFPMGPDVWVPLVPRPDWNRADQRLRVVARLAPGVNVEEATADVEAVAARLGAAFPDTNGGWSARLEPLKSWLIAPQVTRTVLVLLAATGLLLLIACANVSNLLLARALARRREIGMRAALGAGRSRLVRQLLVESMALGLLGAASGLLLTYWALPLVRSLGPGWAPRIDAAEINGEVLLFTLALSLMTGVVFGLAPALQISRGSLQRALQAGCGLAAAGDRRLRNMIVVGELALAVMVLSAAGLLLNSFVRLQQTDPGYRVENVLMIPVNLSGPNHSRTTRVQELIEIFDRVGALPGVVALGASNVGPLAGGSTHSELTVDGKEILTDEDFPIAAYRVVTPGFFEALDIRLQKGRVFTAEEYWRPTRGVAVITETLARQIWPGEDPIGKRIAIGRNNYERFRTVVGVVEDIRDDRLQADPGPLVFLPYTGGAEWMTIMIATEADPAGLLPAIRREIWAVDEDVPLANIASLEEYVSNAVARPRLNMQFMGLFAAAALLLAALGIYGIMAFAVAQRTQEIGVRMALGAEPGRLIRMVLGQATRLTSLGIGLGLLGALWLTRFLKALLYETNPVDGPAYAAAAIILAAVALLAALIPALRATRVDPVVALKTE